MPELKGTQTEKNLLSAFALESQSRNRLTYFAKAAEKEGLVQIAVILEETAEHERSHAKRFLKLLEGARAEVSLPVSATAIGSAEDNLRAVVADKRELGGRLYPSYARTAREEGFQVAATLFAAIAVAELYHAQRCGKLADNLAQGLVFEREEPVVWRCRKCGFIHTAKEAPKSCPACAHPRGWFELIDENY